MTLQETGFYDGPSCWRVFRPVWRPCCFTGHRYASSFLRSCQRRRNRFPYGSTDFRLPGRTGCSGVPLQNVLLPKLNSFCFAFPFLSVFHFAGNLGFRFFFRRKCTLRQTEKWMERGCSPTGFWRTNDIDRIPG